MKRGNFLDLISDPRILCQKERAIVNEEKPRRVLGDLTNRNGKRAISPVLGDFGTKNEDEIRGNARSRSEDDESSDRTYRRMVKGREKSSWVSSNSDNVGDGNMKGLSLLNAKRVRRSMSSGNGSECMKENVVDFPKKPFDKGNLSSLDVDLHIMRGNVAMQGVMEGDGSRDSCISTDSVPGKCDRSGSFSPMLEGEPQGDPSKIGADSMRASVQIEDVNDISKTDAYGTTDEDECEVGDGQFFNSIGTGFQYIDSQESKVDANECLTEAPLNKSSFVGQSRACGSLSSKLFDFESGVETHGYLNGDGECGGNEIDDLDSIKACSCSFCLKAAYLWSDLQCQDTRGRLAALEKSMKSVKLLLERNYNQDGLGQIARENCKKSTKLEFDLMHQWRSLFRHTEDALGREGSHIQSDLHRLQELRGNCKRDLEIIARGSSSKS